jgi:biopolymer transport protein ExbD
MKPHPPSSSLDSASSPPAGAGCRAVPPDRPVSEPALQPMSARFRRRRWQGRIPTLSLNLTPMIDLVFNLLFFFLVVSRFGAIAGMLPMPLPGQAAVASTEVPRTPIRIRLLPADGGDRIGQATIDRFHEGPCPLPMLATELGRILRQEAGFDADTPVHLLAGDEVAWDHMVNAYNAALAAGYHRIFFGGPS